MADKLSTIYTLTEKGIIRYVGQAKDPHKRYKQHCTLGNNKSNTKRCNWLRKCIKDNTLPELTIIMRTSSPDYWEKRIIKKYRKQKMPLVNTSDGGVDMSHTNRAKKNMPWGDKWSPLQRIYITLDQDIKFLDRNGYHDSSDKMKVQLETIHRKVDAIGSDVVNYLLWEKENANT